MSSLAAQSGSSSSGPTTQPQPDGDDGGGGDTTDAAAGPSAQTPTAPPVITSTAPAPTSPPTATSSPGKTPTSPPTSTSSPVKTPTSPPTSTSPVKTPTTPAPTSTSPVNTSTTPASSSTSPVNTSTTPASSSTSPVKPTGTTETATDLSSPSSVRQKEKVTEAIITLLSTVATPSLPAANNKKANNNMPGERGGQKVSKVPVMWSPEKVKGAALGLLAKRWSSEPAGQTPDRTGPSTDLSSSPQKENISEDAPPSKMKENISEDAPPSKMKENISEDGAPPAKMARLCSDAAVAALSAAMGLLAKSPPPAPPLLAKSPPTATPPASSPAAKQQAARHSYAKQIKELSDASPAIMRRYRPAEPPTSPAIMRRCKPRPPRNAESSSSSSPAATRRNKAAAEALPAPAIMRRKTFRSKVKLEGTSSPSPLTSPKSGQKACDRRVDARQKANAARSAPKISSPPKFKVTGAVFCEGRVMGLLATRPIAGASTTSSAAVKRRAESPPPAQGTSVNLSVMTASSPGKQADPKAVKRPTATDVGGQTAGAKVPVTWSPEKVKGATMGLLAKTPDPPSSAQSVQKADERQTCSNVPVTWSPEKVKGVLSLVAKRSAPSSSSDTTEMETAEDSLAVLRLRQRIIRPQRKVVKKGPLQKIAHYVKLGHLNKLPAEIMALPGLYDQVVTEVMKRVKEECAKVTRSAFGSVLRQTSLQALKNFRWEELVEEWRRSAPTFLRFLQSAASVSLDEGGGGRGRGGANGSNNKEASADTAEAKTKKRVAAMAGAMVLHARSRHMRAPMVRNSLLLHAGDKKRCFQRFRTQGLCVSYKQTLTKVKEMGDAYDKEVLQWKEDAINAGGKQQQAAAAEVDRASSLSQPEPLLEDGGGPGENNMAAAGSSAAGQPDIVDAAAAAATIVITI